MQHAARQTAKQPACAGSRRPGRIARVPQRFKCQAPAGTAVAASPATSKSKPQLLQRHQRLSEPAQIGAEGSSTVAVKDFSHLVVNSSGIEEDISLDAYMRLPVEQYYILDPSQIQFLSGSTFILSVPKINLLTATLQPIITVQVTTEKDAVVLQAVDCRLNATGILGDLDSKFAMQFTTKLTWQSQPHRHLSHNHQQQQTQHIEQQHPQVNSISSNGSTGLSAAGDQLRNGWNRLKSLGRNSSNGSSSGSSEGAVSQQGSPSSSFPTAAAAATQSSSTPGSITGTGAVKVWCEVVPPFHLMPKHVLESSCNVVIAGLVNSLLPWFMRQLAGDYQRWAIDEKYRAERRQRTVAKQQQRYHHQDPLQIPVAAELHTV